MQAKWRNTGKKNQSKVNWARNRGTELTQVSCLSPDCRHTEGSAFQTERWPGAFNTLQSQKKQNVILPTSKKQCDSALEYKAQNFQYCSFPLEEVESALTLTQFCKEGKGGRRLEKKKKREEIEKHCTPPNCSLFTNIKIQHIISTKRTSLWE